MRFSPPTGGIEPMYALAGWIGRSDAKMKACWQTA